MRLNERLGIKKVFATPYHPQTNGQTERLNRYILAALRAHLDPATEENWDEILPSIAYAYRVSDFATLRKSTFLMMFHRECTLPTDVIYGRKDEIENDKSGFSLLHTQRLAEAFEKIPERQKIYERRMKTWYDTGKNTQVRG